MNTQNTFLEYVDEARYALISKLEDAKDAQSITTLNEVEMLYISDQQQQTVYDFTLSACNGWSDKYAYQALSMLLKQQGQTAKLAFVKKCWTKYRAKNK